MLAFPYSSCLWVSLKVMIEEKVEEAKEIEEQMDKG